MSGKSKRIPKNTRKRELVTKQKDLSEGEIISKLGLRKDAPEEKILFELNRLNPRLRKELGL